MVVHLFGIRHHGPGCARGLLQALQRLRPDALLVEGPPEGEAVLPLLNDAQMQPPVALLVYPNDHPQHAAFFPMAVFSNLFACLLARCFQAHKRLWPSLNRPWLNPVRALSHLLLGNEDEQNFRLFFSVRQTLPLTPGHPNLQRVLETQLTR